jgi:hypothetical protein
VWRRSVNSLESGLALFIFDPPAQVNSRWPPAWRLKGLFNTLLVVQARCPYHQMVFILKEDSVV